MNYRYKLGRRYRIKTRKGSTINGKIVRCNGNNILIKSDDRGWINLNNYSVKDYELIE